MSDNQIDSSYKIDKIIDKVADMASRLEDMERILQGIRDNTSGLAEIEDIKSYLYEIKNK